MTAYGRIKSVAVSPNRTLKRLVLKKAAVQSQRQRQQDHPDLATAGS